MKKTIKWLKRAQYVLKIVEIMLEIVQKFLKSV